MFEKVDKEELEAFGTILWYIQWERHKFEHNEQWKEPTMAIEEAIDDQGTSLSLQHWSKPRGEELKLKIDATLFPQGLYRNWRCDPRWSR